MFSKILYVTVFVSDQDKALDFYTNSFSFQKHADYKGPEGRFLTIALMACDSLVRLSRGWARTVQGGVVSDRTKRRQKFEFWSLLIVMYTVTLGMTLYARVRP